MTLTEKALRLAIVAHKDQVRKSDGSQYVAHPIIVGMILKEYGFNEAVIAAAFTHDVLEDTPVSREEIVVQLGEEVAQIIDGVSEDKSLVSIADKVHNAESVIADYEIKGKEVWKPFNRGKEKKIWFEELLYAEVRKTWEHPLLERYKVSIERLKRLDD